LSPNNPSAQKLTEPPSQVALLISLVRQKGETVELIKVTIAVLIFMALSVLAFAAIIITIKVTGRIAVKTIIELLFKKTD